MLRSIFVGSSLLVQKERTDNEALIALKCMIDTSSNILDEISINNVNFYPDESVLVKESFMNLFNRLQKLNIIKLGGS